MPDKAQSTNPSSHQSLDIVERLYQLAQSTALAAGKANLACHAGAERQAAEEIRKLRRRIEGLEMRLNRLQEEMVRV
jgi:hypothetical protein